jgi:hypothetical protein
MDSTVRYLGVELEDALAMAEAVEIQGHGPSFADGPMRSFLTGEANVGSHLRLALSASRAVADSIDP